MNKNTITSGILLGLLITVIYIIYRTQFISPQATINEPAEAYNLTTSSNDKQPIASNDEVNIKNNKGFISEKINGVTFSKQMNEIDNYVKLFQDSYDQQLKK